MLNKRLIALLCLLPLAACGDDGDTQCVGHLCGEPAKITDPDGGNILFEYIYLDTELQTVFQTGGQPHIARVIGYFTTQQDPANSPLPMPGVCNNLTMGWPMYQGTSQTMADVGKFTLSGKNRAGGDVSIDVPKLMPLAGQTSVRDSIGRPHPFAYQFLMPNADMYIQPDSFYDVTFSGSDTIAPTTFDDALFMAKDFTVTMPQVEGNGPMRATQPFPVSWTPATSANLPAGQSVLGVTWLVDSNGSPTHMCPVEHGAGTFTIPAATIAEYRQIATSRGANPDKVILLRNAIVHRLQPLPTTDTSNLRRIDMLTVMCWAQLMDCQAN
jgi:hypothetical protein